MTKTKKVVSIALYALIIVVTALTVTESGGLFRTLPLVFILPAVATLLYNKRLLTAAIMFIAVFVLSSAMTGDMFLSLTVAVISAIFSIAGIYVKRLIVIAAVCDEKAKSKRIYCIVLAAAIAVISFGAYFLYFGNPVSMLSARSVNVKYIKENYGEKDINIRYTVYDLKENRYFTKISFKDEAQMNADISVKNKVIIDGYHNYYEYRYMSAREAILSGILSKSFNENFGTGSNIAETDIIFAPNVNAEEVFDKMVFDVYFGNETADEKAFAEKCRAYSEQVKESGFVHKALRFYGGSAGEFFYEMTVESDFSGDLMQKVLPFNENHLVKRQTENDYKEHWDYGR